MGDPAWQSGGGSVDDASTLARLRSATRDLHRRVDGHPVLRPLAAGPIDEPTVRRALVALLGFFDAVDARLRGCEALYAPKAAVIRRDLRDLGAREAELDPPIPGLVPEAHGVARLGLCYVGEGATRGGRVIGPRLAETLGLGPGYGARFFHLADEARWARLCAAIERAGAARVPRGAILRAGRASFLALLRHVDRFGPIRPMHDDHGSRSNFNRP